VKRYGLQRSEGVLLRYVSQLYKTLGQSVPEVVKTEGVWDALGFFRAMIDLTTPASWRNGRASSTPSSAWKARGSARRPRRPSGWRSCSPAPSRSRRGYGPRCTSWSAPWRSGLGGSGRLGAAGPRRPGRPLGRDALRRGDGAVLRRVRRAHLHPEARRHQWTEIRPTGERTWHIVQTLLDPQGDNLWAIQGTIDLRQPQATTGRSSD